LTGRKAPLHPQTSRRYINYFTYLLTTIWYFVADSSVYLRQTYNMDFRDFKHKFLGNPLKHVTGDKLELTYLFQLLSIAIQRGNELCFNGTFVPR